MMMLHPHEGKTVSRGSLLRVAGGEVIRMEVMNQGFRPEAKELFVDLNRRFKMFQRFQILHIADVLAEKGVSILCKTERILQLGAAGEKGTRGERQFQRERGISP